MGDARQTMHSTQPFSLSTSINRAGGGVPAESARPDERTRIANLLTKDNKPSYLVLRAARGARSVCARATRSGLATEAFELSRVTLRRAGGVWVAAAEPVWPGYVLASAASQEAAEELGSVGSLTAAESALVRRLGGSAHIIQLSQGHIADGRLVVDFGPLMGLEALVARIDRHRRLAWLEPEPGRRLAVGLEVTSKS